ncbi:MAG: acyltransferase [Holosporaceae bacterium]|jgi:peptidoglycan/LPS O-acetylase OafA/YrhL|nr:acyltransferase [Holosporaceae bacterium]
MMMDKKKFFFDDLESLRGFACILVFLQHMLWICPLRFLHNIVPRSLSNCTGGVGVFFAISGFVVTLSLLNKFRSSSGESFLERLQSKRSTVFSFYKTRFFRIFPVLMLVVLGTVLFLELTENDAGFCAFIFRVPAEILFGVYNYSVGAYVSVEKIHPCGLGPFWTLAVEAQFYLLWPMALLLFKSNNARALMSLGLGCMFMFVIQPLCLYFFNLDYYNHCNNLSELFLGAFFAFIYEEGIGKDANKTICMVAGIFLAMMIWSYNGTISERGAFFSRIVPSLSSVLLVALCAFVRGSFRIPLLDGLLQYLGSRSYSLYAVQLLIANIVVYYTNSIYFPKESLSEYDFYLYQLIIVIVLVLVVAELSYRFMEKPMRRFVSKSKE